EFDPEVTIVLPGSAIARFRNEGIGSAETARAEDRPPAGGPAEPDSWRPAVAGSVDPRSGAAEGWPGVAGRGHAPQTPAGTGPGAPGAPAAGSGEPRRGVAGSGLGEAGTAGAPGDWPRVAGPGQPPGGPGQPPGGPGPGG